MKSVLTELISEYLAQPTADSEAVGAEMGR